MLKKQVTRRQHIKSVSELHQRTGSFAGLVPVCSLAEPSVCSGSREQGRALVLFVIAIPHAHTRTAR